MNKKSLRRLNKLVRVYESPDEPIDSDWMEFCDLLIARRDELEALVAALEAEVAAFRRAIQMVRGQYPKDVFPPGGSSTDSKGAGMARLTCDNILRAVEAAKKEMLDD